MKKLLWMAAALLLIATLLPAAALADKGNGNGSSQGQGNGNAQVTATASADETPAPESPDGETPAPESPDDEETGGANGLGLALGRGNKNLTDEEKEARQERLEQFRETVRQRVEEMQSARLALRELKQATKEVLAQQRQEVRECKQLLHEQLLALEELTPEERAQYADQIRELFGQVVSAHRYALEIRWAARQEAWNILDNARAEETAPVPQEVEAVAQALEGL